MVGWSASEYFCMSIVSTSSASRASARKSAARIAMMQRWSRRRVSGAGGGRGVSKPGVDGGRY